jgi:hypothetical protein
VRGDKMGEHCYTCERKAPKKDTSNTSRNFNSLRRVTDKNKNTKTPPSVEIGLKSTDIHKHDATLIALQTTHGNQYTQQVAAKIQAKLKINQPGDIYEQEADRVADQVMMMPEPRKVQRKYPGDKNYPRDIGENNRGLVQLKANKTNNNEISAPNYILNNLGNGKPLDKDTRAFMEVRLGHDFSHVKVHSDINAAEAAKTINAKAFTVGKDIVFGTEQYTPNTENGRKLIAHELTHTVQQSNDHIMRQIDDDPRCKPPSSESSVTRTFKCPDYQNDLKLSACLNNKDRLRPGDTGPTVKKVQTGIGRDGIDLGPLDGIYGNKTSKGVMKFKTKHNLGCEYYPDVGPGTMQKLDELCSDIPSDPCDQTFPGDSEIQSAPRLCPNLSCWCKPLDPRLVPIIHAEMRATVPIGAASATSTPEVKVLWDLYLDNLLSTKMYYPESDTKLSPKFNRHPDTDRAEETLVNQYEPHVRDLTNKHLVNRLYATVPIEDTGLTPQQLHPCINFDNAFTAPANLAGGCSTNPYMAGGKDLRSIGGVVHLTKQVNPNDRLLCSVLSRLELHYTVEDNLKFCPDGNPGNFWQKGLTIPLSRLEASHAAYSVYINVKFFRVKYTLNGTFINPDYMQPGAQKAIYDENQDVFDMKHLKKINKDKNRKKNFKWETDEENK